MSITSIDEKKQVVIDQNDEKAETDKQPNADKGSIPPKAVNKDYTYIW